MSAPNPPQPMSTSTASCQPVVSALSWAHYAVLGIPLELVTNTATVMKLAEESLGSWGKPRMDEQQPPLRLYVMECSIAEPFVGAERKEPIQLIRDNRHFMSFGASMTYCDAGAGWGVAYLTPQILQQRTMAKLAALETPALFLASHRRGAPLHAAAIASGEHCLLLTGDSGSGKSMLAYACLRAGFRLLAEDVVFAEPGDGPVRVWGNPFHLHLLPDAVYFFPELRGVPLVRQLNGKWKLRVRVEEVRPGAAVAHMPVWGVLSLSRSERQESRLLPPNLNQIVRSLNGLQGDPPLNRDAMLAATERLLRSHVAHLEVGTDLNVAVDVIRRFLPPTPGG